MHPCIPRHSPKSHSVVSVVGINAPTLCGLLEQTTNRLEVAQVWAWLGHLHPAGGEGGGGSRLASGSWGRFIWVWADGQMFQLSCKCASRAEGRLCADMTMWGTEGHRSSPAPRANTLDETIGGGTGRETDWHWYWWPDSPVMALGCCVALRSRGTAWPSVA